MGKFASGCHERPSGWRGVQLTKKLWAIWAAARQKPGFTLITLRAHTIHITLRGTSISGRLCTIRFIIPGSRKVCLILARSRLSLMRGLRPSIT
jgi:hypothetical protein